MTAEKTIGRYRILERIGRGGMGVLYRGIDPVLDREVAIKAMSTDFDSVENAAEARARFFREAQAAANLQHRNIVTIFEFAEDEGTPYIVMEFLRGQTLAARMSAEQPLSLDQKLDVVSEVCAGLQFAHDHGVVHRDVRPENIWLLEDGTIKVVDFGIAKLLSSTLSRQGDVLGNANYMAPEQVFGGAIDGRADIFSVAVVLYELLAGRRPFAADSPTSTLMRVVREQPAPLDSIVGDLPAGVVAAVAKGLEKKPDDRYQAAGEFATDLQLLRLSLSGGDIASESIQWDESIPTAAQEPAVDASQHRQGDSRRAPETIDRMRRSTTAKPRARPRIFQAATTAAARLRRSQAWLVATTAVIVLGAGIACWSRVVAPRSRTGQSGLGGDAADFGRLSLRGATGTCQVLLDDRNVGVQPIDDLSLAPGTYRIQLRCPDGQVIAGNDVTIIAGQLTMASLR